MEQFLTQFEEHPQIQEYLRNKNWNYKTILKFSILQTLPAQFPDLQDENERSYLVDAINALSKCSNYLSMLF